MGEHGTIPLGLVLVRLMDGGSHMSLTFENEWHASQFAGFMQRIGVASVDRNCYEVVIEKR